MDEELKKLFFSAIDNFPPERQDAAQRWLKESGIGESCRATDRGCRGGAAVRAPVGILARA